MLAAEVCMAEFQKKTGTRNDNWFGATSRKSDRCYKFFSMHMLLQSLQDHITAFESQMADLKFAVNTSFRHADYKLEVC